jgi:hypothetical protein
MNGRFIYCDVDVHAVKSELARQVRDTLAGGHSGATSRNLAATARGGIHNRGAAKSPPPQY